MTEGRYVGLMASSDLDFKGDSPWKLRCRLYDNSRTLDCLILTTEGTVRLSQHATSIIVKRRVSNYSVFLSASGW